MDVFCRNFNGKKFHKFGHCALHLLMKLLLKRFLHEWNEYMEITFLKGSVVFFDLTRRPMFFVTKIR